MSGASRTGSAGSRLERPACRAAFSTRVGGVSEAPYESLNVAVKTGDDADRVRDNRRGSRRRSGSSPPGVVMARQVHGGRAACATRPSSSPRIWAEAVRSPEEADAHATPSRAGAAGDGRRLPAGRPGRARRRRDGPLRLARACRRARGEGGTRGRGDRGGVGPGIGPCCYEVGEEVLAAFAASRRRNRRAGCSTSSRSRGTSCRTPGCRSFDASRLCTSCEAELFYSHRRDGERTGRQAGLVWRS